MTNNPRTYPRRAGQLNVIFTREEKQRERETWMPNGMNARPRSSTSIPGPHLRRGAGMREEGDRSAVACATRITPLNISFISGPEQLPYSTNMRSARGTFAIALTLPRVAPRGRCTAAITRDAAIRCGEWNAVRTLLFPSSSFVFFTSFRFTLPLRVLFPPLHLLFSSLIVPRRISIGLFACRRRNDDSSPRRSRLARDEFAWFRAMLSAAAARGRFLVSARF